MDVGVDCWDYKPISLEKVISVLSKREFRRVDHHEER
jgi:calcineurin-like phosphoesterase family protein